jgi:hypothetical protein
VEEEKRNPLGNVGIKKADIKNVLDSTKKKTLRSTKDKNGDFYEIKNFYEVQPLVHAAVYGFSTLIFCYRQTGSGKTFTMERKLNNPKMFFK